MKVALTLWILAVLSLFAVASYLMASEAHRGFWFVSV